MNVHLGDEHGQALVLFVLFGSIILGMAAAVLDVGAWYRADRQLQATADAAALAGAHTLPLDSSEASALALEYADKNGGGVSANAIGFSMTRVAGDTITVHAQKPMPGIFARVLGISSVTVGATAKAHASAMSEAKWAAPIGVDEQHEKLQCQPSPCFREPTTLDFFKVGPGAFRLINIDSSHGGTSPQTLGDWIENGLDANMPLGWYYSDPGMKPNSANVKHALDARDEDVLLFPVYRETQAQGAGFEYLVVAWAAFHLSDYEIHGSNKSKLFGWFESITWEGVQSESASDPDYGARTVSLIE